MDRSYVHCMLIYWGCLLVKNSFVNISEVNRQCLHSLGTRSEDDFEKVSIFSGYLRLLNQPKIASCAAKKTPDGRSGEEVFDEV